MKTKINLDNKTIIISRTDSIGDVILTLPVCGWLKDKFPTCRTVFLGRNYTKPVLECYDDIDQIITLEEIEELNRDQQVKFIRDLDATAFIHVFPNKFLAELASQASVPYRVGTSHRFFHFFSCNLRPNFTRKNAHEHESQLNFHLLKFFGAESLPSLEQIQECTLRLTPKAQLNNDLAKLLSGSNKKIVLHPRSQGSAMEWPIENYTKLSRQLVKEGYEVFFSGTKQEGASFRGNIPTHKMIHDVSGLMDLASFITFLSKCHAIVACSTGPLHIASVLGLKAVGLYTSKRPMHPGRWKPIGKNISILESDNHNLSKRNDTSELDIDVDKVVGELRVL